jgi:hypothetical protein
LSWDDFEDVNDDMLGSVFQLVSQYEKMGGKLRTDSAKMKGGVLDADDGYKIDLKSQPKDIIARIDTYQSRYKDDSVNSVEFWTERHEYSIKHSRLKKVVKIDHLLWVNYLN